MNLKIIKYIFNITQQDRQNKNEINFKKCKKKITRK